jgi:hypothetical protein
MRRYSSFNDDSASLRPCRKRRSNENAAEHYRKAVMRGLESSNPLCSILVGAKSPEENLAFVVPPTANAIGESGQGV